MYVAFLEDEDEAYVGCTTPLPRDSHSLGSQLAYFKLKGDENAPYRYQPWPAQPRTHWMRAL